MSEIAWQELEQKIEQAARRLRDLGEENAALREKVDGLEAQLAGQVSEAAARWQKERTEVGRRVDSLVERLEGLLAQTRG